MTSNSSIVSLSRNIKPERRVTSLRLHRLKHDISEFWDQPYPGIEIFVQDDNYDKLCLHLTPQSGALVGLRLHFDFELSEDWPQTPPKVRCSFPGGLAHPNVFGDYICCDLLNVYADQTGYKGYTPAFTLRALCMQLLSFFSSSKVDQDYGGSYDVGEEFMTKYVPEEKMSPSHSEYTETCRSILSRFSYGCPCEMCSGSAEKVDGKDFTDALPGAKTSRRYINFDEDKNKSFKAGSWTGWRTGDIVQREIEVTRIVRERKSPHKNYSARVRHRNPIWYESYKSMRKWAGCDKCKYNKGGPSLVEDSLMSTLKDAVNKIDRTHPEAEDESEELVPDAEDATDNSSKNCELLKLGPDLLLVLADHLPTESMNSLASVFPPFKSTIEQYHVALYRDLQCFFLRKGLNAPAIHRDFGKTILGIGVAIENRTFRSSFDWLSLEAFEVYSVRKGVDKASFEFYLPMVFSQSHFERAYPIIWQCINQMAQQLQIQEGRGQQKGRRQPQQRQRYQSRQQRIPERLQEDSVLLPLRSNSPNPNARNIRVIYQFMNNIVVSLMKACDDVLLSTNPYAPKKQLLQASEKSIVAYCQLFYLLTRLAGATPSIRTDAFQVLNQFRLSPDGRTKDIVPDLGQLIVQLCLVNGTVDVNHENPAFRRAFSWPKHMTGPFLQEVMIRNVRWVLKENPTLKNFEPGASDFRLQETFKHSRTSIRLVMFQTFFLRFVVRNHQMNPTHLQQNFGFPPEGVAESVVKEIKKIYAVKGWREYFQYIGYEKGLTWSKEHFCGLLKECVVESKQRGYHN